MAERQAGILVKLVNTAAVKQYDGLKYSDDQHDAFWLAHLLRLGILPTGYIDPKPQRAIRDLLRRRLFLVRSASSQLISVQSQIWRSTGIRIATEELKKTTFQIRLEEAYVYQAIQADLTVYRAIQQEIQQLEQSVFVGQAFSEAAHFAVRYAPLAQRFYERKKAKTNGIVAIRAVARKLARATWMMLKHQQPYEAKLMFPG